MAYKLQRGYTAKGQYNNYMDYAYESGDRTYRVFKTRATLMRTNYGSRSTGINLSRIKYANVYGPQPKNYHTGLTLSRFRNVPYGPDPQTYGPMYNIPLNRGFIGSATSFGTTDLSSFNSGFNIIMMFVLLLSYCAIAFGTVNKSPFDTGLEIASYISSLGSSAKEGFIESLKTFADDLESMSKLSPTNWGSIESASDFFGSIWSSLKIPFTFLSFIFDLFSLLFKFIFGISSIILGLV